MREAFASKDSLVDFSLLGKLIIPRIRPREQNSLCRRGRMTKESDRVLKLFR